MWFVTSPDMPDMFVAMLTLADALAAAAEVIKDQDQPIRCTAWYFMDSHGVG